MGEPGGGGGERNNQRGVERERGKKTRQVGGGGNTELGWLGESKQERKPVRNCLQESLKTK